MPVAAVRQVDAVVVGGGPVGLVAAHLIESAGLKAIVLEKRAEAAAGRWTMPVLDRESKLILDRFGGDEALRVRLGTREGVCTRRFEQALRDLAEKRGIPIVHGITVGKVQQRSAGGVVVHATSAQGAEQAFRAQLLLDATGGRLAGSAGRGMALRPLPEWTDMVIGLWPYQPHLPALFDIPTGRTAIFGPNNPLDGATATVEVAAKRIGAQHRARFMNQETVRGAYEQAGHGAGLIGHVTEQPYVFELRQALAARAAAGDVLAMGDSVAKVNFKTAQGLNSGIRDALRATEALEQIVELGAQARRRGRAEIIKHYETQTLADHREIINEGRKRYYPKDVTPPPLAEFPELNPII